MPKRQSAPNGKAHDRKAGTPQQPEAAEPRKLGRKPGKQSCADYTQTSIYSPIELRNQVRAKLYEQGMEMSGPVEEMLRDWLSKQRLN